MAGLNQQPLDKEPAHGGYSELKKPKKRVKIKKRPVINKKPKRVKIKKRQIINKFENSDGGNIWFATLVPDGAASWPRVGGYY